jgi:hypothetical protein
VSAEQMTGNVPVQVKEHICGALQTQSSLNPGVFHSDEVDSLQSYLCELLLCVTY